MIKKLDSFDPARRKVWAAQILVWSFVLMLINVGLYVGGVIDQTALILVTLILSWLAITLTAVDVVCSTDVRDNLD